jgi:hypothetical protein
VAIDTLQIAQDMPVWNPEHHLYNQGAARPGMIRYDLLHGFLMGHFKDSIYNRQMTYASGRPDRKGHYDKAPRGPHHRVEVRTREQIRRHADVFHAFYEARANADIAVLVTEGNRGWTTASYHHEDRPAPGGAVQGYAHVGALGRPWKYVLDRDVSSEHVADTLVVAAPWLTEATARRIVDLPEDRTIVAVGGIPTQNEYQQSLPQGLANELQSRVTAVDGWGSLPSAVDRAEGLQGDFTTISDGSFWFWGPQAGRRNYPIPVPKLETRRVHHDGNMYIAVSNHAGQIAPGSDVVAPLPWAGDRTIRELTTETPTERVYPEGEYLSFSPYSVRIFEVTDPE